MFHDEMYFQNREFPSNFQSINLWIIEVKFVHIIFTTKLQFQHFTTVCMCPKKPSSTMRCIFETEKLQLTFNQSIYGLVDQKRVKKHLA